MLTLVLLACASDTQAEAPPPAPEPPAPTAPAAPEISSVYNVKGAPIELVSVAYDAAKGMLVTTVRNRAGENIEGVGLAVRYVDAQGAEVLAQKGNRYDAGGYYTYWGHGGPYACADGAECTLRWGSSANPVPPAFHDVLVVPDTIAGSLQRGDIWRANVADRAKLFEDPSVEATPNPR